MIPVYAVFVAVGFLALLTWVFLALTAGSVAGKESLDPEQRYGPRGRYLVAGLLGFGLGGMSASFGGWGGTALVAAIGGAALMVGGASFLGVDEETDEDSA
ncbi:MAG: hypothetical protein QNJ77_09415 [Acidimicrobiia bacterium]|nr:hypothetical protein [Acidimicrobiia bacterium]